MTLTRRFEATLKERINKDPEFQNALLVEAYERWIDNDVATTNAIMQSYTNAMGGGKELFFQKALQASYKANLETLLDLTNKAFEGVEKIVDLNLNASKAALTEVTEHSQAAVSAKDIQELMTLQANFLRPLVEKTFAYNRELYDITSAYSAECSKVYEAQAAVLQKKFQELLNNTTHTTPNTPPKSESVVAMVQSTVTAANDALESVQKAVKQATSVAENNFKTMTENASKVAATTARSTAGVKKGKAA